MWLSQCQEASPEVVVVVLGEGDSRKDSISLSSANLRGNAATVAVEKIQVQHSR